MDKQEQIRIIEEMQQTAEQMRLDDIEENPESAFEMFDCSACGKTKPYAGSIQYNNYRLCNDCVLLAETGFALGRFKDINELIAAMEDKRLEEICSFIKKEELRGNN